MSILGTVLIVISVIVGGAVILALIGLVALISDAWSH